MAMKINTIENQVGNLFGIDSIGDVFSNTKYLTGDVINATNTDVQNLIQKFTDFKLSPLGTIVLDHVTLYVNSTETLASGSSVYKNNKLNNVNDTLIDIGNTKTLELERLKQAFSLKKPAAGTPPYYSVLLDHVFITVSRSKHIITDIAQGIDGTIKQMWNNGDYNISLTGLIAGSNKYQTDTKKIKKLNALLSLSQNVQVDSIYLNTIFDIFDISITEFDFTQSADYSNITEFTINSLSDFQLPNYEILQTDNIYIK